MSNVVVFSGAATAYKPHVKWRCAVQAPTQVCLLTRQYSVPTDQVHEVRSCAVPGCCSKSADDYEMDP